MDPSVAALAEKQGWIHSIHFTDDSMNKIRIESRGVPTYTNDAVHSSSSSIGSGGSGGGDSSSDVAAGEGAGGASIGKTDLFAWDGARKQLVHTIETASYVLREEREIIESDDKMKGSVRLTFKRDIDFENTTAKKPRTLMYTFKCKRADPSG
jgi:hypothetical protein